MDKNRHINKIFLMTPIKMLMYNSIFTVLRFGTSVASNYSCQGWSYPKEGLVLSCFFVIIHKSNRTS